MPHPLQTSLTALRLIKKYYSKSKAERRSEYGPDAITGLCYTAGYVKRNTYTQLLATDFKLALEFHIRPLSTSPGLAFWFNTESERLSALDTAISYLEERLHETDI